MLNNDSRMWLVVGVWCAMVTGIVGGSVAAGATGSLSTLLCLLCAAPMAVALLIGLDAPSPTVAEILYAVNNRKEVR